MTALTARIGEGQTIVRFAWTRLDGSASTGDNVRYSWELISGKAQSCQLIGRTQPVAQFSASDAGTYVVQLTVSSGDQTDVAVAVIDVTQFVARIVGATEGERYGSIPLDGTSSIAPAEASYVWSVDPESANIVTDPSDAKRAILVPENAGQHRVTLTCTAELSGESGPETRSVQASHTVAVAESTPGGGEEDELHWRDELRDGRNKAIDDVRASAAKWEASITGFLTLFAAVTFVTGPKVLSDVDSEGSAKLAVVLVGVAFVVAFVARVNLADVANSTPIFGDALTPLEYRAKEWESAKRGATKLRTSRSLAIAATLLVAGGSLMMAFASIDNTPPSAPKLLARTSTETRCGVLSTDAAGIVSIAGVEIGATEEVVVVTNCNPPASEATGKAATQPASILILVLGLSGLAIGIWTSRMWVLGPAVGAAAVFVGAALWYRADAGVNINEGWSTTWAIPAMTVASVTIGYLSDYLPRWKHAR